MIQTTLWDSPLGLNQQQLPTMTIQLHQLHHLLLLYLLLILPLLLLLQTLTLDWVTTLDTLQGHHCIRPWLLHPPKMMREKTKNLPVLKEKSGSALMACAFLVKSAVMVTSTATTTRTKIIATRVLSPKATSTVATKLPAWILLKDAMEFLTAGTVQMSTCVSLDAIQKLNLLAHPVADALKKDNSVMALMTVKMMNQLDVPPSHLVLK